MKKERGVYLILVLFIFALATFLIVRYTELFGFAVLDDIQVRRILPLTAEIDKQAIVILEVNINKNPGSMIIEETIPDGWELNYADYDKKSGNTISWILQKDGKRKSESQQIIYTVIPKTEIGVFSGKIETSYYINPEEASIKGNTELDLTSTTSECGDNICNIDESCSSCPIDCEKCITQINTAILRPDGDIESQTLKCCSDSDLWYNTINKEILQPNTPDNENYVYGELDENYDIFTMSDFNLESGTATQIKIWIYATNNAIYEQYKGWKGDISLDRGNTWTSQKSFNMPNEMENPEWFSITFEGAWSQEEINNLAVKLTLDTGGATQYCYAMYAEVSYG